MSSPALSSAYARLGLRLIAVFFFLQALWQLLGNLLASAPDFDPSYLGFYLRSQALRPALGMVIAVALYALSGRLARRLAGAPPA